MRFAIVGLSRIDAARIALFCLLLGTGCASATDHLLQQFRYDPRRINVGGMYQYLKSNRDGSHPDNLYIYVASQTRLDALKLEPGAKAEHKSRLEPVVVNSIGEMDWSALSAGRLEMWHEFMDGERLLVLTAERTAGTPRLLLKRRDARGILTPMPPSEVQQPTYLPAQMFGWELIETNFALPHLVNPEDDFSVGLMHLNLNPTVAGPTFVFGRATFGYDGEVQHEGAPCRRYSMSGGPLDSQQAVLWVDKAAHHIVDFVSPVPNSPDWQDLRLKLIAVSRMSTREWAAFKASETRSYFNASSNED